jgi:hypothetical protein
MAERNGRRKPRGTNTRLPNIKYYLIVTDTKETEINYLKGLRDSIPVESQEKVVLTVRKSKNALKLINDARTESSKLPQYYETWIVFDRDQVPNFDNIITSAKANNINVGWSNPCIEIWFSAYFGAMPTCNDSVSCNDSFEKIYLKVTKQKYDKADKDIYAKLGRFGDETNAITLAKQKIREHEKNGKRSHAQMCPATTLHNLIEEIKVKVNPQLEAMRRFCEGNLNCDEPIPEFEQASFREVEIK